MFTGIGIFEFTEKFRTEKDCIKYLFEIKWQDEVICRKCQHTGWSKTVNPFTMKCNRCKHKESVTADTLFHKCKFSLRKAFMIVYLMSSGKKGISSFELSRQLNLRQKTCWLFQQKVRVAMGSSLQYPLKNNVEVDETMFGGPESGKQGRSKGKKKEVVVAIECDSYGIQRCYARTIKGAGTKQLRPFFEDHISKDAKVKTDGWRGYRGLKKDYLNLEQVISEKGKNFPLLHRQIMMIKGWLRGIYHRVNHLQLYLNEWCYRFNRIQHTDTIFHNLLDRMMKNLPTTYKEMKNGWGI
jgi:transposase-like protein